MNYVINYEHLKRETKVQQEIIETLMRDAGTKNSVITQMQERITELEGELAEAKKRLAKYESKYEGRV